MLDNNRINQLDVNERRKKKIREDLSYLNANRLTLLRTGAYTPEELAADEAALDLELANLREMEVASDISMRETVNEVVKLSELLKNVVPYYSFANAEEKEKVIRVIFSELSVHENTLQYKCRNGFRALESRFVAKCDEIITNARTFFESY